MNEPEKEKKPRDRREILALLARKITEMEPGRRASSEPPRHPLRAETALVLDDLLGVARSRLGLDPAETFARIVELGIVAWYCELGASERERVGLAERDLFAGEGSDRRVDQLQLSLCRPSASFAETVPSAAAHHDDEPEDPNPAAAQQKADAYSYQTGAFGYTPMTIHALAGGQNKGPNHARNGQNPGKKRRPISSQEGGQGRRNRKNRGRKH